VRNSKRIYQLTNEPVMWEQVDNSGMEALRRYRWAPQDALRSHEVDPQPAQKPEKFRCNNCREECPVSAHEGPPGVLLTAHTDDGVTSYTWLCPACSADSEFGGLLSSQRKYQYEAAGVDEVDPGGVPSA
jgi:hypothetical protein